MCSQTYRIITIPITFSPQKKKNLIQKHSLRFTIDTYVLSNIHDVLFFCFLLIRMFFIVCNNNISHNFYNKFNLILCYRT